MEQVCGRRDECWQEMAAKDGMGRTVRTPPPVTRPRRCGFEVDGQVWSCPLYRRHGGPERPGGEQEHG